MVSGSGGGVAEEIGLGWGLSYYWWWWWWWFWGSLWLWEGMMVSVLLWLWWSLSFGHQTFRGALLGRVVPCVEDLCGAADPVVGHVVVVMVVWKRRSDVYVVIVEIDEVGFGVGAGIEAEDLYPSRQRLVPQFLLPPSIHLLLVSARGVVAERHGYGHSPVDLGRQDDVVHHVGMSEAVRFDGVVVEPRAIARLPFQAADHAKFRAAATRHVVAAFLQLDGGGAVEAALPASLLGDLDEFLRRGVLGAFAARVPFVVARTADFHLASLTFAVLSASVGAAACINVDVCGFDPRAATPSGAVDTILGRILLVLSIPFSLEAVIEELVDVFQVDALFGAAGRGHMLWVCRRKREDAAETGVTHAVFAGQQGGFGDWNVI